MPISRNVMSVEDVYQKIKSYKSSNGTYHKIIFHLHTPASHDYKFFPVPGFQNNEQYKNMKFKEFLEIESSKAVLQFIAGNIFKLPDDKVMDPYFDGSYGNLFESETEYLAYLIIAKQLFDSDIEMVVVMDHQTLDGIKKLKAAVQCIHNCGFEGVYTEVIPGIEISCADKFHLAVILNPGILPELNLSNDGTYGENASTVRPKTGYEKMIDWIKANLYSKEYGSFQTSFWAANDLKKLFGNDIMTYIAHIYSGLSFDHDVEEQEKTNKKLLSKAYQKVVFCRSCFDAVGVKEPEHREKVSSILERISGLSPCFKKFVLDNDAHNILDISLRYFFIKSCKLSYQAIQEALLDYDIAVSFDAVNENSSFIEGMYIRRRGASQGTDYQFLTGVNGGNDDFVMTFAPSMNCIIGGRGTGKSTLIMLLNLALRQKCRGWDDLYFAGLNGKISVLFKYMDNEYLLDLDLPQMSDKSNFIKVFSKKKNFNDNLFDAVDFLIDDIDIYDDDFVGYLIQRKYIKLHARKTDGHWKFCNGENCDEILSHFLKKRILIVDMLDKTMRSNDFRDFVFAALFKPDEYRQVKPLDAKVYKRFSLFHLLDSVDHDIQERAGFIQSRLQHFNYRYSNFMLLNYSAHKCVLTFDQFADLLNYRVNLKRWYSDGNVKYNLKISDFIDYMQVTFEELELKQALMMLKEGNYNAFKMPKNIFQPIDGLSNHEIRKVDEQSWTRIIKHAGETILSEKDKIKRYIYASLREIDGFDLKFNVNNKESLRNESDHYVRYDMLSMGQKSVALIDLLLEGGELIGDTSPILFDQPEDNLDGRYIYKNLTRQFRETKDKRQIIVATHNATIVTNTVAEQVYVLESNGIHGWIMQKGFAADNKIKKYIISYLEGGMDSFNHKVSIYKNVLKST